MLLSSYIPYIYIYKRKHYGFPTHIIIVHNAVITTLLSHDGSMPWNGKMHGCFILHTTSTSITRSNMR